MSAQTGSFFRPDWPALALLVLVGSAQAQTVYRVVGPDGRVTFSDRPPASGKEMPTAQTASAGSSNPALPYELKQVVGRFPVTLYTSANCGPCASAKALLMQRGVPFTEKTVNSNEDLAALQNLSGSSSLPFGTVGAQQIKGFSSQEWNDYLDAASYPAQSQLPRGYRQPDPKPLVALAAPPAASTSSAAATPAARSTQPPAPRTPMPDPRANPAGIRF